MRIAEATVERIAALWAVVEPQVQQARCLDEAAQALATTIHQELEESVVLARVFMTVPFMSLPMGVEEFARGLAEGAGVAQELKATTPVLALLGTAGERRQWNDRHASEGHLGIPLISSAFVESIPMISRLLKELGVPMQWLDSQDTKMIEQTVGRSSGLFYVEDAGRATDKQGRKIIAAQDFVTDYGVKSVFGSGGAYAGGQIVILVVFCREELEREVAQRFLALMVMFKDKTRRLVGNAKFFSEEFRD